MSYVVPFKHIVFYRPQMKRKRLKKKKDCPNIKTIQKMVTCFLTKKHMTEEKLASALGITTKTLKQFYSEQAPLPLMSKINLSLVKLYCLTKFND